MTELLDANSERRRSGLPVITKVLYRECGLIIASFRGHIELFDRVDFKSKGVWDNTLNKSSVQKISSVAKKPKSRRSDELLEQTVRPQSHRAGGEN